jgi:hypothetical protein
MSKSVVYEALNGLEQNKGAFRGTHAFWYPESPSKIDDSKKQKTRRGFFDWLESRAEREEKRKDLELRISSARCKRWEMLNEYYIANNVTDDMIVPQHVITKIEKECRKQYGLSATDPL